MTRLRSTRALVGPALLALTAGLVPSAARGGSPPKPATTAPAGAAASSSPAPVASDTACAKAIKAFDETYDDRSDEKAMTAARALVKTCAGDDAQQGRALSRVGMIQYQRKQTAAAVTTFEESVRLAPKNSTLYLSLCGIYTEASRYHDAIETCETGLELARDQDDGSEEKHDRVLRIGYNLALAKMKRGGSLCMDHSIWDMLDAFREAYPENAWVYQGLGAWVWDCEDDFDRGFALYKKSCALGQESACEQVRYTESCLCQERQGG
jgi:tetratricopeptide (TPR) repeat protein